MTTYICKCGRTFQKNTGAGTTGFRMPDYGPAHECYGCPFVQKECWRENGKNVDAYACRGSKVLDYQTDAYCCDSKGAALHVRTLDLGFIRAFIKAYLTLPGHTYEHPIHGMDSPENGRWPYSFGFASNKKGEADRNTLIDRYFRSEGERPGALPAGADCLVRKDVTPEQEKEIVLNQIKEAKALAQGKAKPAGMAYRHGDWRYFVDRREDNGKFTAFMASTADSVTAGMRTEVSAIPDFDAFEEAQNALDGYALKRKFTAEHSGPDEKPETERPENDPDDIGPDGMEELAEYQELTRPDAGSADDAPKSDGNEADSEDGADEAPDFEANSDDSANDAPEAPSQVCDWQNASGDDEKESEAGESAEVTGDPLSLRGPEFDAVIATADTVLNRLVAMLHAKKQRDGEMTVKVTFEDANGAGSYIFSGAVSGKINYTVKPQKIVGNAVELQFDAQGNPIVPADREHQLSFDELQPGREIPPAGGTATVDGKTGIVECFESDPNAQEDQTPYTDGEEVEKEDHA